MACCSRPKVVEGYDLENDPVMKDLRENFREEDVRDSREGGFGSGGEGFGRGEGKGSEFERKLLLGVVIVVLMLLVLWYVA
ncbi:MAG: hypothetical protein ABH864_02315 [archaeon]